MKKRMQLFNVRIAVAILLLLLILATANVLISEYMLKNLSQDLEEISVGESEKAKDLAHRFSRCAFFLSITVNHDDLENVEELFVELAAIAGTDDAAEMETLKSRLISVLRQIRRLCGIGIDSII